MPDLPPNSPLDPPKQGDSIDRFVEARMTQERLDWIWEQLQAPQSRSGFSAWIDNLRVSFAGILTPRRVAWGVSFATILMTAIWWSEQPNAIEFRAVSKESLAGEISLPRNLRILPAKGRIELYEGGSNLGGSLMPVFTNNLGTVRQFAVDLLSSVDPASSIRVRGNLWVTNALGRTALNSSADVDQVLLDATVERPNLVPFPIRMDFKAGK